MHEERMANVTSEELNLHPGGHGGQLERSDT